MSDLLDPRVLLNLASLSIRDPQEGAKAVLRVAPPRNALWLAFALAVVASLFLGELVSLIIPTPEASQFSGQSRMVLGLFQAVLLFLMVHAITHIGRACGGTGSFDGALALVIWLQFIFLLLQVVQILLLLIAPLVAVIASLLAVGLFFWLLVNFIAALHGFPNVGTVFIMTLLSFLGIVFAFSLILALLGVQPEAVWIPA